MDQNLDFEIGYDIKYGCSAILMDQMMYIGGSGIRKKQVCCLKFSHQTRVPSQRTLVSVSIYLKLLKLDGCRMIKQADLPFDASYPACNSFEETIPRILICFNYYDPKVCHT